MYNMWIISVKIIVDDQDKSYITKHGKENYFLKDLSYVRGL